MRKNNSKTEEGSEEATERPGENEDTSQYMKEMQDFKEGQQVLGKKPWEPSDGMSAHPMFWFIWNEVPGNNDAPFLGHLADILGASWIMEATVEKSSDTLSMIVIKGDNMIQLELCPELSGVIITDKAGEVLREVTARTSEKKTYCFSALICNRKLANGPLCFDAAMLGNTKCTYHYRPTEGRKPGLTTLAVTSVTTGAGCLPSDAMYFWSQNKPEIAQFVKDLVESLRIKIGWDTSHVLMNELRYIAVQMVSRDLMTNTAISANFKSAIHDPETGEIVAFKAHYLLSSITTFDARIQQKLKDFGLLVPPSRTEDTHSIPGELSLFWTPLKRVNAIDVTARTVDPDNAHGSKDDKETEEEV
jgi:hypothetical protein